MDDRREESARPQLRALGRRDLLKLGSGVVATALAAPRISAQGRGGQGGGPGGAAANANMIRPNTGVGYVNNYNRLAGNGPMDDNTRKIVSYVHGFKESDITPAALTAANRVMVDSMACFLAGFEEPPSRAGARLATHANPTKFKSTVLGYGISTTPELAAFANGCMIRATDFNDNGPGGHTSDLIPAALAIGEAVHATGAQVLAAIILGYEISGAPIGGESVRAAMVAGKLLGMDEDRLANAVGIALIPHVALNKGVGALSMWKGVRTAEATKCGVWSALAAYEGMTGPPQPFEGRGSLWATSGAPNPYTLPVNAQQFGIERTWQKRFTADAQNHGMLMTLPAVRAWTNADEIAAINYELSLGSLQEVGSNPKWDPRNRETADHSIPWCMARSLIDGREIYLDSFKDENYPFRDPAVKALMDKITLTPVARGGGRFIVRKKSGEVRNFEFWNGETPNMETYRKMMPDSEITNKFNRAFDYRQVSASQRDQARATWSNLTAVKDIAEAMRALAAFGKPLPL